MMDDGEDVRFDWRRGGAAAAGLVAALFLVGMVFLVKFANDAREQALTTERQANQVALIVRNVSANISRAEAALARFVLDEKVDPNGNIYASDWQLAGYQIQQLKGLERNSPEQLRRVYDAEALYNKRSASLPSRPARRWRSRAIPVSAISMPRRAMSRDTETGRLLDDKLEDIIRAERQARAEASSKASSSPPRPTSSPTI